MHEAKVSVASLAHAADVSVQAVYKWIRTGQIARDRLPAIVRTVERSADFILTGVEIREPPANYIARSPIQIMGFVEGGTSEGEFRLAGAGTACVDFPKTFDEEYGLAMRSDSFGPRVRAGEILLIAPHQQCQPGDDVVLTTSEGKKMLLQYLYPRITGTMTFGSINHGAGVITLGSAQIADMHQVFVRLPASFFREGKAPGAGQIFSPSHKPPATFG